MTLTLELPEDLARQLSALPNAQEFAVAAIRTAFDSTLDQHEETLTSIQHGLDDFKSGRAVTLDDARDAVRSALANRLIHIRHSVRRPISISEARQILTNQ